MRRLARIPLVTPRPFPHAFIFSVLLISMLLPGFASAQDEKLAGKTEIRSQKMTYSHKKGKVEFSGDVHVLRPDMQIWSQKLTIYFAEDAEAQKGQTVSRGFGQGKVQKIVAEDKVRIEQEERIGECEIAVYDVGKEVLRLEGSPVLKEGKNKISGKVIKLYLKENRSEIIGGQKGQVEALFFTPEEE